MSKNFLLAASALTALAFAGAANAGNISGASVGGDILTVTSGVVSPYVVAKDFALPSVGLTTSAATFSFANTTNPINVSANTDYVVTLTLSGTAKFVDQSTTTIAFGGQTTTATPILSADGKTLTVYAKTPTTLTGTPTLAAVTAAGFKIQVTAQESVSVAYKLQQIAGSQTLDLDSSSAAEVIAFKTALKLYEGSPVAATAALPNFLSFKGVSGALNSTTFASTSNTAYNTDLSGTNVPAITSIVTGYSAVVTGPQVKDMLTSFDGIAITSATAVTNTSATFTATTGADAFNLVLTPKADTPIQEGVYRAAVTPTYAAGWSGPASVEKTVVTVGLDGTNFYAPWFGLGGTAANSTLRIGNNGGSATGNIVIQLKARNGSTATATSVTFPGVAANGFRSITGAELRQAFGTDAANADLLISIQSAAFGVVSAKVRTTQPSGQIFENSLDVLRPVAATADAVSTVQTTVNSILANQNP